MNILVLSKSKTDTTTQFIDASGLFKKETNNNVLLDEHIEQIMAVFDSKAHVDHFAQSVPFEKVAGNDYNLSVSSYVEAEAEQQREAQALIDEEKLNTYAAKRYITNSLKREFASDSGTELNSVLPKMSPLNPQYLTKKQTVFQKIAAFVEKFKGVGGQV
ncbi:Type I restriction enzyme [Delftia sp. K82]|nr:Type I restriction enzyme [Delftia sp. K82]